MPNIQITTSTIPVGACVGLTQDQWNTLVSLLLANADLSVNLHIGDTPPSDLTKKWARTVSGVYDRDYIYSSGVWLAKHPDAERIGKTEFAPAGFAAADVDTWDGGEAGAVTAFSGPMWEIDTDFAAMFPIGPGTLPSGIVLAEGNTGGEEKHPLTIGEIPPHHHVVLANLAETEGGTGVLRLRSNSTESESDSVTASAGGTGGAVEPHQNMPPYRVRYLLRKTARTHYRAS